MKLSWIEILYLGFLTFQDSAQWDFECHLDNITEGWWYSVIIEYKFFNTSTNYPNFRKIKSQHLGELISECVEKQQKWKKDKTYHIDIIFLVNR